MRHILLALALVAGTSLSAQSTTVNGGLQTGLGQLDCGTQTGTTGADDDSIEFQNRNTHAHSLQRIAAAHAV